jgi:hypothetical protein
MTLSDLLWKMSSFPLLYGSENSFAWFCQVAAVNIGKIHVTREHQNKNGNIAILIQSM